MSFDIYGSRIPNKLRILRGDRARIMFSTGDGAGLNMGIQQYGIRYAQRNDMRPDMSDPDARIIIKGFPDVGQATFVSSGFRKNHLLSFIARFGDICNLAENNITMVVDSPINCEDVNTDTILLRGVWLNSMNLAISLDSPLINATLGLSFISMEIPST